VHSLPLTSPKEKGLQAEIFRRKSAPVARSGEAVVCGFREGAFLLLPRHIVNGSEEDAAVRRDTPMILHAFSIGGPHRCAQQQELDPDEGPDHRKMWREALGWMQE
jgi:hypothetical protein